MAQNYVLSLSSIYTFFKEHGAQLKKGENSYRSGYVSKFLYESSISPPLIQGNVMASMKKKEYTVEMFLSLDGEIERMSCDCPRGKEICHHMAALALHCHYNVSVTDKSCRWSKKKTEAGSVIKVTDIFPINKTFTATTRNVTTEEIDTFKRNLADCHAVGFTWLLRPDVSANIVNIVPPIEEILFSKDYLEATNKDLFLASKLSLTMEQIYEIEKATMGQSKNENWLVAKKHRLTASRFGLILNCMKKNKYPPSMFKNILGVYNLEKVSAVQWGREHESSAVEAFKISTGLKTQQSGLWLDECGFLGASPDGIVENDAILEIKCPYKFRNTPLTFEDKNYIIYRENGEDVVNGNHIYYHQIQGQLFITKKEKCYLVIWTPQECRIFQINKDEEWEENLNLLKKFYFEKFIPFICNNK